MTARTDHEREEFEKWLGIKPCGAAHDFGWEAWKARAALAATPAADAEVVAEKADPLDALRWGANVAETLLSIGRAIGFGRAQQILGEQWEAEHNCAPRGRMGVTVKDDAQSATPAAATVVLPEPWGYLVEGRIFIGRLLPQHVSSMVDAEGFEPTKLYTEPQMRALLATASAETEPFGYFKAEPFGWTDCGPDDEGAVALYENPQVLATGGQARAEKGCK